MTTTPSATPRLARTVAPWFVAAGILVFSLSLRSPIVGVAPLIELIRRDSGFSATVAGLLTTIPVLCFGVVSFFAPWLGRRFGIERSIFVALLVLFAGILLRLVPDTAALFCGTFLVGASIAVGNVLLPGLIKRDFPTRVGLMTGLYTMLLSAGAATAAATVVPLVQATGWGWREVLALTAAPVLVAILIWLPQLRLKHVATGGGLAGIGRMLRSPLAWCVTLAMGLQSFGYYALAAWIPAIFTGAGSTAAQAGVLLALGSLAGIAGSFLTPIFAARARTQIGIGLVAIGLVAASIVALLVAPGPLAIPLNLVLGFGQGMTLSIALLVIVLRTPSAAAASDLSGMAQGFGYLLAATGPILLGALHDATGDWTVSLIFALGVLIVQGVFTVLSGRDRVIPEDSRSVGSAAGRVGGGTESTAPPVE